MRAFLVVFVGFGVVWLAMVAALGLRLALARAISWLHFRSQVRTLERELDMLVRQSDRHEEA